MTTYRAHYPRMPRTLTRALAVEIIERHGFRPWEATSFWPEENCGDPESTFDAMLGVHDTYDTAEVFRWLGYDDMTDC